MSDHVDQLIADALADEARGLDVNAAAARARFDRRVRRYRHRRRAIVGGGSILVLLLGTAIWLGLDSRPPEQVDTAGPQSPTPSVVPSTAPLGTSVPSTGSVGTAGPPQWAATPAVIATGWGVVVVDDHGAQHVVEDLTDGSGNWNYSATVPIDGHQVVQRVSRAFSDLQGGVVYGTDNAIVWLPADGSRHVLAAVAPLDVSSELSEGVDLQDVAEIDGAIRIVYTQTTIHTGVDFNGSAQLVTLPLQGGSPTLVESYGWTGTGPDWQYYGQVSYANGTYSVVRSWNQGSCTWVDVLGADGRVLPGAGPFPRPADPATCPYETIGAATLSGDGSLLDVVQGDGTTVERYQVADGTLVDTVELPASPEPIAIDEDGSALSVVVRPACAPAPSGASSCGSLASASLMRGELQREPIATLAEGDPRLVTDGPSIVSLAD